MRFPDPAKAKESFDQKMTFTTGPVELNRMLKDENVNVVGVRAAEDFAKGHVPAAANLPKEKWDAAEGLKKDKINVLYCYAEQCHLAANATLEFASGGFPAMEIEGGFEAWKENDLDVEK
jgi:rhodanese-related sulfurtransferase